MSHEVLSSRPSGDEFSTARAELELRQQKALVRKGRDMLRVKPGANLIGLQPPIIIAAYVYDMLRQSQGWGDGTITSGTDEADNIGADRVEGTWHERGWAVDLRTTDLPGGALGASARTLKLWMVNVMGRWFDVLLESDHIHVEPGPQLAAMINAAGGRGW